MTQKTPTEKTSGDNEDDNFSTGKAICAFGLIIVALLMFTLPLSKLILAVDMATHFTAHYMVAGGALLIGFFMPRWNVTVATALTIAGVFLIGYLAVNKSDVVEKPAIANTTRVKLMTFNTWMQNRNWQALTKEIERSNPDIVTLMEFSRAKEPLLDALKTKYPYQLKCLDVSSCNLVILSKFPFTDSIVRVRWYGPPYVRVTFGKELGSLNLFAVHTIRPPFYRAQFRQIGALANAVNEHKELKIVMGDFNATPFSRTLNTFAKRTKLKRLSDIPTWPATFAGLPQVAIDHIFVSPEIKVLAPSRLGNNAESDHFPVNVVVAVPKG